MILPEGVLQTRSVVSCSLNLGKDKQSLAMEHKFYMELRQKEVRLARLPLLVGGQASRICLPEM
jgi:hypothetical protein